MLQTITSQKSLKALVINLSTVRNTSNCEINSTHFGTDLFSEHKPPFQILGSLFKRVKQYGYQKHTPFKFLTFHLQNTADAEVEIHYL